MKKSLVFFILIGYLISYSQLSYSLPKTDSDFLLLPPYCSARYGRGMPGQGEKWSRHFGRKSYVHLHHYCSALDFRNKANFSFNKKDKLALLKKAIKQHDYILQHVPKNSILMPENYFHIGEIYLEMGKIDLGLKAFKIAIKINKNYARGYAAISDYYLKAGKKEEATAILQEGLLYTPNSKGLNRRLNKIIQ